MGKPIGRKGKTITLKLKTMPSKGKTITSEVKTMLLRWAFDHSAMGMRSAQIPLPLPAPTRC
jgi:hypothetical protein